MLWELFESPSLWFLYPWYILTQFSTSKPAGTRRSSLNRPENQSDYVFKYLSSDNDTANPLTKH